MAIRDFGFGALPASNVSTNPLLQQQGVVNRLTNQHINTTGQAPETDKPGLLERVFDVLSRPNYAVAEFTDRMLDREQGSNEVANWWDAARGAVSGLAGTQKTTFSEVLENQGVENELVRGVGGFALDVLLDPTTYLSGGISAGGKLDDVAKASRVARRVGSQASGPTAIRLQRMSDALEIAGTARHGNEGFREALEKTIKEEGIDASADGGTKKAVKKLEKKARDRAAADQLDNASSILNVPLSDTERHLLPEIELRFLGKRIGGIQEPVGFNRFRNELSEKNRLANWANRSFSTKYNLPDGMNEMLLRNSGREVNWAINTSRSYRNALKKYDLSPEERSALSHALESGIKPGQAHLDEAYEVTRSLLDKMFDEESALGLHAKGGKLENYIPHIYRKAGDDLAKANIYGGQTLGGRARLRSGERRQFKSLAEAEAAGYEPVTDVVDLIGHRLQDHQQAMAQASFLDDVRETYGLLPKKIEKATGDLDNPVFQLDADVPSDIGGLGFSEKAAHKKYKKYLEENGFKPHSFQVYDRASDSIHKVEYMVPDRIKQALNHVQKIADDTDAASQFARSYDRVHGLWKAWATVLNPGHHARNQIGDFFMSWEGGAANPRSFAQAMRTVLSDKDVPGWLAAVRPDLQDVIPKSNKIKIGKKDFDNKEIYRWFQEEGLGTGYYRAETVESSFAPLEAVRRFSGGREDVTRFAHFLEKMKQGAREVDELDESTLNKLRRDAAKSTRKWLIDYADTTPFEQNTVKRFSSFYTFMRKNLPLQLESVFLQPGKIAAVPKAMQAIQEALGTNDLSADIESRIPDWMREEGNFLISGGTNPRTMNLALPIQESFDRFGGVLSPTAGQGSAWDRVQAGAQQVAGQNPLLKSIAELATGRSTFTGGPIDENLPQYLSQLIPGGRVAAGATGVFGEGPDPRAGELVRNWLTGLSTQTATDQRQEAELRRQEDVLRVLLEQLGVQ